MGSRYFLISFLPDLHFDKAPEMSLDEVMFFAGLNLSIHEMRSVNLLHTFFDIENACRHLLGTPMTALGSLNRRELQEKLEEEDLDLPGAHTFFSRYLTRESRQKNAHKLIRFFLEEIPPSFPSFIYNYFQIEHTLRLLTGYLRAQAMGKPFSINNQPFDFEIDNTKTWPEPYSDLYSLWNNRPKEAREFEKGLSKWKFEAIENLCAHSKPFSLDFFLSYLIRLRIVEAQIELNDPVHLNIIERIAKATR